MNPDTRRDLVLIGAGLAGVAVAAYLQSERRPNRARETTGVAAPALIAASTLARKIGKRVGVKSQQLWLHAAVGFATGATLTYFGDELEDLVPGLKLTG